MQVIVIFLCSTAHCSHCFNKKNLSIATTLRQLQNHKRQALTWSSEAEDASAVRSISSIILVSGFAVFSPCTYALYTLPSAEIAAKSMVNFVCQPRGICQHLDGNGLILTITDFLMDVLELSNDCPFDKFELSNSSSCVKDDTDLYRSSWC